jgi:CRP/FNR family transcriptional regulator, cyclic AMP receptor protein
MPARVAAGFGNRPGGALRPAGGSGRVVAPPSRPRRPMTETIWYLKRCPLFARLTPDECRRVEARSRARTFPRGAAVYAPDDPGESVLLLTEGRVKIRTVTPDGRETILVFVEPGELFGELALVDPAPRDEYAEAVQDSRLLAIPRDELLGLIARRPDVALSVTKLLGLRLRRVENRLKNILFRSTRERLVALLLELVGSHGRLVAGGWEVGVRLTHQDFANLIGSSRESVTLTLGRLQRDGLIAVVRRRVVVRDRARLASEAAGLTAPPVGRQGATR